MLPSILDLERQLQRLEPIEDPQLRTAVRIGKALLSHLRNAGTPASPPPSAKTMAQTLALRTVGLPAHMVRPRARTTAVEVPPSPPAPRVAPRQPANTVARVAGSVTMAEMAERTGFARSYLNNLLWDGVLPKPAFPGGGNAPSCWSAEQADEVAAIMADPERRKRRQPAREPIPADWVSAKQFAARLGYANVSRIHSLATLGDIPAAEFRQGRNVYWRESVVAHVAANHPRVKPRNRKQKAQA